MSTTNHPAGPEEPAKNQGSRASPGGVSRFLEVVNLPDGEHWLDELPDLYQEWKRTQEGHQ